MMATRPEVLDELRGMMRRGATPAHLLRTIIERHRPEALTGWVLMDYLMEGFSLPLDKASAVHGWRPDGSGEVSDARIDVLLLPAIMRSAPAWDGGDVRTPQEAGRWYDGLRWPGDAGAAEEGHRYGLSKEAWETLPEPDRQVFRANFAGGYQMAITAQFLAALAEQLQRRVAQLEGEPKGVREPEGVRNR